MEPISSFLSRRCDLSFCVAKSASRHVAPLETFFEKKNPDLSFWS